MRRLPLYDRLPAIHRIKDEELGAPLRAYLDPLERAFGAVKDSIEALYHDLFIDTCADWVIPYIGDLLGTSHLAGDAWTLRADVADTIFLRRAKGTLGAIERLAHDLTEWGAHPIELRENLVWAQALNHQRPDRGGVVENKPRYGRHTVVRGGFATIRDPAVLSLLDTPYDGFARFPDVKRPRPYSVHYNLPNLAVFLWRLASYRIERHAKLATASPAITSSGAGFVARFHIDQLAVPTAPRTVRLFGRSKFDPERRPIVLTPLDAQPAPIPRARLTTERPDDKDPIGAGAVEAYVAVNEYDPANPQTFAIADLPIGLHLPIGLEPKWTFRGANLCAWEGGLAPPLAEGEIAIDPVIGRIAIGVASQAAAQQLVDDLVIDYHYAAVGPVGAHPVTRDPFPEDLPPPIVVDSQPGSLAAALATLGNVTSTPLVVEIRDSGVYDFDPGTDLVCGRPLYLRAADDVRPIVRLARPLRFIAAQLDDPQLTKIRIDGILFTAGDGYAAADPLITRAAIDTLDLRGCTLDPGGYQVLDGTAGGSRAPARVAMRLDTADVMALKARPSIELHRTITGALFVDSDAYALTLASSIVDACATDATAIAGSGDPATTFGPLTQIDGVTIFGRTRVSQIGGRGGIFTGRLTVDNDQTGCLKLCWFSGDGDRLPQSSGCLRGDDARLVFTSEVFGHEAYAQLALDADRRILERGPNDDQMGAYGFLLEAHKWKNLTIRLREFTPVGVRPLLIPAT